MRQRKKAEMYPLIKSWQESGKSKTSFCQSQDIKLHTFIYWVNKYESETGKKKLANKTGKFISIEVSPPVEGNISLYYANGVRLNLSGQVNSEYLATLIKLGSHV